MDKINLVSLVSLVSLTPVCFLGEKLKANAKASSQGDPQVEKLNFARHEVCVCVTHTIREHFLVYH
jgi:hypothetical protein